MPGGLKIGSNQILPIFSLLVDQELPQTGGRRALPHASVVISSSPST
jgi:hypothetical protein